MNMEETGTEVYVSTMEEVLSESYYYLDDNLNHFEMIKLKSDPRDNIGYFYAEILVDVDIIHISISFRTNYLGYIAHIFDDTYDYIFSILDIKNDKDFMNFIKKIHVCDVDVLKPEYIITYEILLKEATRT